MTKTKSEITKSLKTGKKREFVYKRLSASMLKTFLMCKRQFYNKYILGIPQPPNPSFSLGNAVHEALEKANISLIENPRNLNDEEIEYFVDQFRSRLSKEFVDDPSLFSQGEKMVKGELSSLDYSNKILKAEMKFHVETPEGVRLYGFIDKIEEVDSDTLRVVDYKTSKQPLPYEEAKVDEQLAMYDLVAAMMFPHKKRELCFKYVKDGKEVKLHKSAIDQLNFRRRLVHIDKEIKSFVESVKEKGFEEPKGDENNMCPWCSFRFNCPNYTDSISRRSSSLLSIEDITNENFVDTYIQIKNTIDFLEEFKTMLKMYVLQELEKDPEVYLTNGDKKISTLSTTRKEYDPELLFQLLGKERFLKVCKVGNTTLKKVLKEVEDRKIVAKIEQSAEVKFNSPQIRLYKDSKDK